MKQLPVLRRPYFARKVLEVGGGHAPYRGVTHAVDKYPHDNTQRGGDFVLPGGAEFHLGDLESLPFKNGENFDFIYASHVFEHVENPLKAAAEINRVSKKGYVETPSPLREQLACPIPFDSFHDFHTYFCWSKGGTFHCIRKSEETIGQFPETRAGRIARALFDLRRNEGLDLEPLLSRKVKTTSYYFSNGFRLKVFDNFIQASKEGACAYEQSVSTLLNDIHFPGFLRSKKFIRLKKLLQEHLPE